MQSAGRNKAISGPVNGLKFSFTPSRQTQKSERVNHVLMRKGLTCFLPIHIPPTQLSELKLSPFLHDLLPWSPLGKATSPSFACPWGLGTKSSSGVLLRLSKYDGHSGKRNLQPIQNGAVCPWASRLPTFAHFPFSLYSLLSESYRAEGKRDWGMVAGGLTFGPEISSF